MEELREYNAADLSGCPSKLPTIHVISDSVGVTAQAVARAAAAQFGETNPNIEVLPKARSFEEITSFLEKHVDMAREYLHQERILVFFTLVDWKLKEQLEAYLAERPHIIAVDLLTSAVDGISLISGATPSTMPGSLRAADSNYFHRIEAMEFTIAHDDGRNPQDLTKADIVILGVSRSSKTPTSVYLSQQGFKVANIPLDLSSEPPKELYQVDRTRLFGLMTSPDVLIGIRRRRLGNAAVVASDYADPEHVYQDLEQARALMRKLGCIVIHTENRAVEETAQEILRYYERSHPAVPDMMAEA